MSKARALANIRFGVADGVSRDSGCNLWTSSKNAVLCYSTEGLYGQIPVGETISNIEFGGPNVNRLYITAVTSLYVIYLRVSGLPKLTL